MKINFKRGSHPHAGGLRSPTTYNTIENEIAIALNQLSQWQEPYLTKAVGLLVAHTLRLEHGDSIKLGASLRSIEEGKEIKKMIWLI